MSRTVKHRAAKAVEPEPVQLASESEPEPEPSEPDLPAEQSATAAPESSACTKIIVWDFDDTLVPWYRLKRGNDTAGAKLPDPGPSKQLYAQLFALQKAAQESGGLEAAVGDGAVSERAYCIDDLPGPARAAFNRIRAAPRPTHAAELEAAVDTMHHNWVGRARAVLGQLRANGCRQLLLTGAPLPAAHAKLHVMGFAEFFSAFDVFSANPDMGDKHTALRIAVRGCRSAICVGDGKQEAKAAAALGLRFVRVAGPADFEAVVPLAC